jgi:hypothetical protein
MIKNKKQTNKCKVRKVPFWNRPIILVKNKKVLSIMKKTGNFFKKLFTPNYNEFNLFLLGYAFLFLMLFDPVFRNKIIGFVIFIFREDAEKFNFLVLLWPLLLLAGIVLSIFHAFSKKAKNKLEYYLMFLFGIMVNGAIAVNALTYILDNSGGWLILFPLWNAVIFLTHLVYIRAAFEHDEEWPEMSESNLKEIATGAIMGSILLGITCSLQFHWAIQFSLVQGVSPTYTYFKRKTLLKV